MTIDDVPADTITVLTSELNRLFKFAKCNPTCHACKVKIEVGASFQLLTLNKRDEMLCVECDREKLIAAKIEDTRKLEEWRNRPHANQSLKNGKWGYSRPSKDQSPAPAAGAEGS